jgi:hypothetical protein
MAFSVPLADGGPARLAPIYDVMGLGADAEGNVYFTERAGNRVRKGSPAGIISTIAERGREVAAVMVGPAANAQWFLPYAITRGS